MEHQLPCATPELLLVELICKWSQWPTDNHLVSPTLEMLKGALRNGLVGLGAVADTLLLPSSQRFE